MHGSPADWLALCATSLLLGMRHGLDADHLATIDGLVRVNRARAAGFARWCGTLFSLGHGAVVIAIAGGFGALGGHWTPPGWLETVGSAVSIGFLLLLGVANGRAVLAARPGRIVEPVGVRGRWVGRLVQGRSPAGVAAVGALFALSFDTVSQAMLFAAAAVPHGSVGHALVLGAIFVAGMLITDGINGWWVARLVARSDALAAAASRIMGAGIACASLVVAGLGIARLGSPRVDAWTQGRSLVFGLTVIAVVGCGYLLALAMARRPGRH